MNMTQKSRIAFLLAVGVLIVAAMLGIVLVTGERAQAATPQTAALTTKPQGCNKPAYTAEFKRLHAMCRNLLRRAGETRPDGRWGSITANTCWADSGSKSSCNWSITHELRKLVRGNDGVLRRTGKLVRSQKCNGTAKVVGKTHFKVTYLSQQCVA